MATKIKFAVRFHDPDSDKVLKLSAFGERGQEQLKKYFTSEDVWAQIIAPIGYLELPTISFRDDFIIVAAVCEMPYPSAVPQTLLNWGDAQADIEYEFGGVECKMELLDIAVSVQEGGRRGCGKSRRGRARKTRRNKTRRC